ncbi:uncharacterized protein MONOS_15020 [Monocercomonoides exilis]|uniref:uncharacterized protein n=1 Tax=Monocercomonoides exilis TaxID=2049356 RepID=UPI00355A6166|nr:hypothetical protein MONOS_15020 [Monocercomonoides exilis]|eukprot:MONOS_15020.1-p1 / transcript=MONOS_15020.1 / gene=MONOS_15020 / organism=Monocercomonoides_exilis_PA203 / gene_product=unspecified product / transcript_product=unspecified product / location=Mono_scaffold01128:2650-4226(-) / protein_length=438 / sequence_SO=supercontig / SO=protein_coding / is_pseudo=false
MLSKDGMEKDNTKKFNELFSELEHYDEDKQRKKIGETNEIIDGMNEEEFRSIFKSELFDKIDKMIEEKKMSIENTILLLKHAGCCVKLKNVFIPSFGKSSLANRFEKMIIKEEKKKEEKNEKLFVDLCECYLLFHFDFSSELISICVPCLLKAASKKEESEENQKEVEMALLALSEMGYCEMKQEQFLKEITEIIKHQQKHRNLTHLAYQSAWLFFMYRFFKDRNLEDTIANELHFGREAARELEELARCIGWKKKGGEETNKEEAKEKLTLMRWLETCAMYFLDCRLWNEEFIGLFCRIVQIYRAAKDNCRGICILCTYPLRNAVENRVVRVEDLLKGGAVEAVLEEMQRPTLKKVMTNECLQFLTNVSERLNEKMDNKMEEAKRKATKRKVFEKLEEGGYEDTITTFHELFHLLKMIIFDSYELSEDVSDYLVNV